MPPGRGSLGCKILATMVLARLNTFLSSEANLKGSLFSRANRSSDHSSFCVADGLSSVDSALVSSGDAGFLSGEVDAGNKSEVSVLMCSKVVDPTGGAPVGFEPGRSVLGSGRDCRVLLSTASSLRLPRWLRVWARARRAGLLLRGLKTERLLNVNDSFSGLSDEEEAWERGGE